MVETIALGSWCMTRSGRLLVNSGVRNLEDESGGVVRFVWNFRSSFLDGWAEVDGARQKAVKHCVQWNGHLVRVNAQPDVNEVQFGLVDPGQMQQHV